MAQLLADENFPLPAVTELRRLGHDVVTIAELGKANQAFSDPDVLALAVTEGRALVTLNRKHFIRLHQTTPAHNGIITCTIDPDFAALAQRIDAALQSQVIEGSLIRVNRLD
ncbi:MAG TPA: DUF5615 family PIN-like protein [Herpetosiphonaceae bacterium]